MCSSLWLMLVFPLRFGASAVLLEQPTPENILSAIEREGVPRLFTVPTLYRAMTPLAAGYDVSSLKSCHREHLQDRQKPSI